MNDPKPTPAIIAEHFRKVAEGAAKTGDALKAVAESHQKKPYVRPEHLTHKPFRENAALREMQDKLRIQEGRRSRHPKAKRQR